MLAEPFNNDENSCIEEVDNGKRPKSNNLIYRIYFTNSFYLKADHGRSQVEEDRNDKDYVDNYMQPHLNFTPKKEGGLLNGFDCYSELLRVTYFTQYPLLNIQSFYVWWMFVGGYFLISKSVLGFFL